LPMVVSGGDTLGDLIAAKELGRVVPPNDVDAVAQSLIEILQLSFDRARFAPVVEMVRWSHVVEPLARYVASPWRNGDRQTVVTALPPVPVTPLWKLPSKAVASFRTSGIEGLLYNIRSYLAWRWAR